MITSRLDFFLYVLELWFFGTSLRQNIIFWMLFLFVSQAVSLRLLVLNQ